MQKGAVQHKAGAGSGNAWTLKYVPRKGSFGQKTPLPVIYRNTPQNGDF